MSKIYVAYHTHSDLSLLDSCTSYQKYIDEAVEEGMTAISISEHGKPLNWIDKKIYAESKGLKYIHSCEVYLTENPEEKVRDNYHCVCLCKNLDGVKELNKLISLGGTEEQFYYVPRITFEQFVNMSDNIMTTSACLASPLNHLSEDDPWYEKLVKKFTYLEIQPHINKEQKEYNLKLLRLSNEYNKPLIAGVDAHSLNHYKDECRDILLVAKHKYYGDEGFDLVWKTYDELVDAFELQGVIPKEIYLEAIENTNRMAEQVEEFEIDQEFKYPILYGSREKDAEVFKQVVEDKFQEKLKLGIIPPEQELAFRKAIDEEVDVFLKLNMGAFMLSMANILGYAKDNGMAIGTSRGSVGGSRVAYVLDIIDLNPETWHTNFYRFANPDRLEPGDIDVDCIESDRPKIFDYIVREFGSDKTARVAAYGTLQDKAVIDEIGRALDILYKGRLLKQVLPDITTKELNNKQTLETLFKKHFPGEVSPWNLDKVKQIKSEFEKDPERARLAYKQLFYYYDGLVNTRISQSVHPAGMVISSITLDDNIGTFIKDGERCLFLDMDNAHDANLIKYDMLLLKTVKVIDDTCKYLGIPYPRTHEIDWNDQDVWKDMISSHAGLFQFESQFAFDSLKKFKPKSIEDVTLVTAAIRPSGASYRDRLLARKPETGWPDQINEILKDNYYYLVYQEDVLEILQKACGFSGGEADTVRRGIAKKKLDLIEAVTPRIIDGYCEKSSKPRSESEEEAKKLIQILIDSSSYMFGYNHAVAYSLLTYMCAYFRYHHPMEFLTSFLNNAANDDDIRNGSAYAKQVGIKITMPKWGVSKSDYFFDSEKGIISKGLSSIKHMGSSVADQLYELSHRKQYDNFMMLLRDVKNETDIDSRQIDILIKIDFFSSFGNQRELLYIKDLFEQIFKSGKVKQISKKKLEEIPQIRQIVAKYSNGLTRSGAEAASYTVLDLDSILVESEQGILSMKMPDLSLYDKVRNFNKVMGYSGYVSGEEKDRKMLVVEKIFPLKRKKDGRQFGYTFVATSIGSGKQTRYTVLNTTYNDMPVSEGDIINLLGWHREGQYFNIDYYSKVTA